MNAGTHLGETKDVFVEAQVLRADGTIETRGVEALAFAYRRSALTAGEIVLEAAFRVETARDAAFAQIISDTKARRRATQPVTLPSGGSTFANPPGRKAWELIDQAGLRGRRVGDAEISALHPNFIVNLGDATAEDVDTLIRLAQHEVDRRFKIRLEPEVVRVGEWEETG
jgi:UDP-N-acetylmuramate dehydrogenase